MSMFKKVKVVILPTNQQTNYLMVYSDVEKTKGKLILNGLKNDEYKEYQHLYIISDDEIKKGDYIYCTITNAIEIAKYNHDYLIRDWKKVIATTDTSLYIHQKETISLPERVFYLPQPSQEFIQKYIEEYNRGNIITDVLVEYENKFEGKEYVDELDAYGYDKVKSILKINSQDNNITIKIAKDSCSREEVDRLLDEQASKTTAEMLEKFKDYKSREEVIGFGNKVKEYCKDGWKSDSLHRVFFEWDKWVKENLS